jgi:hypothetical protein
MPSHALPLPWDIPSVILEALKDCPIPPHETPDHKWRYAYELIVGAAAIAWLGVRPVHCGRGSLALSVRPEGRDPAPRRR